MNHDDATTREGILEATVKLLFSSPSERLTTRRIAKEAGVNVAAINYHFRTKGELLEKAIEAATATAFEKGMEVLFAPGRPPLDRLRDFLAGYAFGLVKFPALTRTAFLGLFTREEGSSYYGRYTKEMFEKVRQVIAEARGRGGAPVDGADNGLRSLMTLSCVIFPFLVTNTMRDAGAIDYSDDEARRRYIDTTLAVLVGGNAAGSGGKVKEENQNG